VSSSYVLVSLGSCGLAYALARLGWAGSAFGPASRGVGGESSGRSICSTTCLLAVVVLPGVPGWYEERRRPHRGRARVLLGAPGVGRRTLYRRGLVIRRRLEPTGARGSLRQMPVPKTRAASGRAPEFGHTPVFCALRPGGGAWAQDQGVLRDLAPGWRSCRAAAEPKREAWIETTPSDPALRSCSWTRRTAGTSSSTRAGSCAGGSCPPLGARAEEDLLAERIRDDRPVEAVFESGAYRPRNPVPRRGALPWREGGDLQRDAALQGPRDVERLRPPVIRVDHRREPAGDRVRACVRNSSR